jgi:FAD/FMN-containing dehydrogenase
MTAIPGFSGAVLIEGDDGFGTYASPVGAPSAVLRASDVDDVVAAVRHATTTGLALSVRSGGHTAGFLTTVPGGLVLDLSAINEVAVHGSAVTVGSGATWGAVAAALAPHGLALSSGDTRSVGVGGLTLGGGVGWLVRQYGLALDSLRSARVVTADGRVVTASTDENSELFWALRGGGGNFGVVTHFEFDAHPLAGVVHGVITFETDDLGALLRGYRDVMRAAPEQLNVTFMKFPPMGPVAPGGPALHVVWASDDLDEAMQHIAPLTQLPGVAGHEFSVKPYGDVLEELHPPEPGGEAPTVVGNNGWARELGDETIAAIAAADAGFGAAAIMIRYVRGAFNRVGADATAFAWRDAEALVVSMAFLAPGAAEASIAAVHESWRGVAGHTEGTYGNFVMSADPAVVALMYPPATLERLRAVKREWDPANLFSQTQNVAP